MLSPEQLTALYRAHRDHAVLSVYINADQHDFAERDAWRVNLRHGLDEAAREVADASHAERNAFDAARERIESAVDAVAAEAFLPGPGWVGFATSEQLLHEEQLDVPTPDLVRWGTAPRIAPYIRAFKQARPMLLVVLDRREAAIYRYLGHRLEELQTLHADTWLGDLAEIEISKRPATRTGVRGKTGTDAAGSLLDNAAHKLVMRIIRELEEAGHDAPVVIGGTKEQVSALARALPDTFAGRVIEDPSFHADMTAAERTERMAATASRVSDRRQDRLLDEAVARSHTQGDACLGIDAVERGLREQRVRTLLISASLQQRDPDLADRLVAEALADSGADVHLLVRDAGERLDRLGNGAAALLHYRIPGPEGEAA